MSYYKPVSRVRPKCMHFHELWQLNCFLCVPKMQIRCSVEDYSLYFLPSHLVVTILYIVYRVKGVRCTWASSSRVCTRTPSQRRYCQCRQLQGYSSLLVQWVPAFMARPVCTCLRTRVSLGTRYSRATTSTWWQITVVSWLLLRTSAGTAVVRPYSTLLTKGRRGTLTSFITNPYEYMVSRQNPGKTRQLCYCSGPAKSSTSG